MWVMGHTYDYSEGEGRKIGLKRMLRERMQNCCWSIQKKKLQLNKKSTSQI
jgi:hypothetical protein